MFSTLDPRIKSLETLITPEELINKFPSSTEINAHIRSMRFQTKQIILGHDDRLMVIIGPCSIHDVGESLEYAKRLKYLSETYQDILHIIMRVYFEKPRTTFGWKGLINDPQLDGSFKINKGLVLARKLLLDINQLKIPAATEFLDTCIPAYLSDLITWGAVGARTVESQIHRELASGLNFPVGFKNNTEGNLQVAMDAVNVAKHAHHFIGISKKGFPQILKTMGNDICHIVLRGSHLHTNYGPKEVKHAAIALIRAGLNPRLMIDCSHGNSLKDYRRQFHVLEAILSQLRDGSKYIFGLMIESNLVSGKQTLRSRNELVYGQSITDACIGWDETEQFLKKIAQTVVNIRLKKKV